MNNNNKRYPILAPYGVYSVALIFNTIASLVAFFIPLYGLFIGLRASQIGFLLALPSVFQMSLRLVGGALSDYFGEKFVMGITFGSALMAGIMFYNLSPYWALVNGQVFMGIARSVYWTATQSYASRIPGVDPRKMLGKLNSFVSAGRILGVLAGGWAIQMAGYGTSFSLIIWLSLVGFLLALLLPKMSQGDRTKKFFDVFKLLPGAFKERVLRLGALSAFLAGIINAITASFYPVWLADDLGFTAGVISFLIALRGVGSIMAGILFGYILKVFGFKRVIVGACLISTILLALVPFSRGLLLIMVNVFVIGLTSGILMVYYQAVALEYNNSNRGFILSFVGLAWSFAFLVGPIIFGLLADYLGVRWSFFTLGLALAVFSITTKKLFDNLQTSSET